MIVSGEKFQQRFDRQGELIISDAEFVDCTFNNCAFSMTDQLPRRSIVRNTAFRNTVALNCNVGPAILEEVVIDGIETGDILLVWSPFLRHVVLRGNVGTLKVNSVPGIESDPRAREEFRVARLDYYSSVDWAVDISEAAFKDCTLRGIPASKVRRDPRTQVVVRRETVSRQEWRSRVSPTASYWVDVIDIFLSRAEDDDLVLIAPKLVAAKRLSQLVGGLRHLQEIGVAELD